MILRGHIISGEFDEQTNEFSLLHIKHFSTQITLKETQLNTLLNYLNNHLDKDDQVLTLYDQMPLRLNNEEINQLASDLKKVKSLYQ